MVRLPAPSSRHVPASLRRNVPTVIARILDPLRAEWYEGQGLHTVCPTRVAIDMLESAVREGAPRSGPGPATEPAETA